MSKSIDTDDTDDSGDMPQNAPSKSQLGPTVCTYCGNQFVDEQLLSLHHAYEHGERITAAERTAYETARAEERDAIRLFRLKALAGLLVIYFGFVIVYAFVI